MSLYRYISDFIKSFYNNSRNALLITGARQTGKTYSIREFGNEFKSFIEINFIEHPELVSLFSNATSAKDILLRLSVFTDKPLIPGETLIFFDEVQCCENIVTAVKFLVDDAKYRYILSGSLLGVELKDIRSNPVGYMGIKEMYPMSFNEFIINLGVSERVINDLNDCWVKQREVDKIIHEKMMQLFRLYLIVGGMPAAVADYVQTNNLSIVMNTQKDIVSLYRQDISQYAEKDKLKIREIFDLIPSELDAKNKRFILKRLNEHAKFDRYQDSFLWLKDAGVAIPVYNVEEPKNPLRLAETRNLFKLFSNDVGLLAAQYADGLQLKILSGDTSINYGAIYENMIAQELLAAGFNLYYYNNKKRGEIDFIISKDGKVLPIEVKSGKDYDRHSALSNVMECKEYDINKAVVLCNGNMKCNGNVVYAPIYMIMFIKNEERTPGVYKLDLSALQ